MELTQALILALIQGITEFLPVSSSAHLILLPTITDLPDQGLAFDVALNTATWLAICIYLRGDLASLARDLVGRPKTNLANTNIMAAHDGKLVWMLLVATVPVALVGFFFHDFISGSLRNYKVIAWSSIFWGGMLWVADSIKGSRELKSVGWGTTIFVGLAQAIALIPGTSRSGITITAALGAGLTRTSAARFSFLLSIPVGVLAGAFEITNLMERGVDTPWMLVAIGFAVSFIAAYISIHLFFELIKRTSLKGFVVYRVMLGILLLLILGG